MKTDNVDINQRIAEARQLSMAAPIITPILEAKKLMAFRKILAAHRAGHAPDTNAIAEASVIDAIQTEIRNKLEDLNYKPEKK